MKLIKSAPGALLIAGAMIVGAVGAKPALATAVLSNGNQTLTITFDCVISGGGVSSSMTTSKCA